MKGRGRVTFLVSVGLFLAAGCGSRTSTLGDEFEDPDGPGVAGAGANGTGANGTGGAGAVAGRPGRAGSSSGGAPVGTAGGGPIPVGGAAFGGASFGGAFPAGGSAFAGSFSFGGAVGTGGSFPAGGFAGQPSLDCQTCLLQSCNGELAQCFQDFGCISIFSCVQATGCETFQCYSPDTCRGVIDQWGGPGGQSMSMLLKTVTCMLQSGCPCN